MNQIYIDNQRRGIKDEESNTFDRKSKNISAIIESIMNKSIG